MLTTHAVDFDALRAREYARLDAAGHAYLDYTGAALHAASHLEAHHALLADGLFGNPHAESEASTRSTIEIEQARRLVLAFFGVDAATHAVCFTANATAAARLVGEAYPFGPGTPLVLTADNHNSINGLRAFARRLGAPVATLPLRQDLRLDDATGRLADVAAGAGRGLLAFPAQSNFSGVRHDLRLVGEAQSLGFRVLLDAAAYVPTQALDLRTVPADFAILSFYKLFGYPTGVGALLATHEALASLRRPWFGGGTVDFVSIQHERHQWRRGEEGFEDGTPNYLGIAALRPGFACFERVGTDAVQAHVREHTHAFLTGLAAMTHRNGRPLAEIYGPLCEPDRGATVAFNLRDAAGRTVVYPRVEARARQARVALRGGCFCNPGAAETAFRFDAAETARCLTAVADDFSIERFASCLGDHATVGAVRVSFGIPTNVSDVQRGLDVLASFAE